MIIALFLGYRYFIGDSAPYYGAGVFPVAFDPDSQRALGLVGIDDHTGQWADFGGYRENGELNPVVTACREFVEETIGEILFHLVQPPPLLHAVSHQAPPR